MYNVTMTINVKIDSKNALDAYEIAIQNLTTGTYTAEDVTSISAIQEH